MAKKTSIILGISPSTKQLGLAVVEQSELLEWQVKTFTGEWSDKKLSKILSVIVKMSNDYSITGIALKMPHSSKSSPALDTLVLKIKEFAKNKKIRIYKFSLDELKSKFTGTSSISKRELVAIATIYDQHYNEIQSRHDLYYMKLLEAITVARAVAYRKI
jgi:RNase H-fold protein (predicted Holliday junction resolvase)